MDTPELIFCVAGGTVFFGLAILHTRGHTVLIVWNADKMLAAIPWVDMHLGDIHGAGMHGGVWDLSSRWECGALKRGNRRRVPDQRRRLPQCHACRRQERPQAVMGVFR